MLDAEDQTHVAWCDESGLTNYQYDGGSTENISSPTCLGRPELGLDNDGLPHLVWFSDEVENVNGVSSPGELLYESIRTENGWSNPAIVAQTSLPTQPAVASQPSGELHLAWIDAQGDTVSLNYARQDPYQCDVNALTELGKVALETMQSGGYHPPDYQVPYCHNQFVDFIYQPNPEPAFSSDPPDPNGGFDRVAELAETVQYEVLFVNMEWDANDNNLSPGSSFARGVADLYQRIKADPSQYPRGLLVRILLGNYPEISTLEWGTQIWNVMNDLRDAGVDELENPEIGWKVEVADYAGTYPHSHTKFMIVDGKLLLGAGFNYGWLHLPTDHPSGKGEDLVDLGVVVLGPVAQAAISAYDDMWVGANMLHCRDFHPTDGTTWTETCQWSKATGGHLPEVLKYFPMDTQQNAFSLFRTLVYKEADETYAAVLGSAESSIDAIHVNFSLELICIANLLVEDLCTFDNALPWMQAIMNAVEQNQIKVRVIVENANSNGIENRVAIQVFTNDLKKRGLEDFVEIRFFNGRMHSKTALIDQELLVVGSQNFHYSSWGERGLNEYGVASDDPEAIALYQKMFDYYWEQAISVEEADWANAN
jgi:phosphatidylserine/phosphatidylglycerophosphate/cardiolipin synthase-like enzyme